MKRASSKKKNIGRRQLIAGIATLAALRKDFVLADSSPTRIASLDWALAETMVALGHTPLAVVAAADWKRFVVEPELPESTLDIGLQQELNFELLARLRPDLILISPFLVHLAPQIERIAETLNLSVFDDGPNPLAQRIEVTRKIGLRLGSSTQAEHFIAETEVAFDTLARRVAALPARPLLFVTFIDTRHVRVYAGASLVQNVIRRIGLQNAWTAPVGYFGFSTVGIEKLATTEDVQLIAFDPVPPDLNQQLQQSRLWTELPFIKAGRIATLPPVFMFGALPTALRLAELLVSELEAQIG